MMKFSIITFGCRVNQADSVQLEEQLRARGAEPSSSANADVVFVNTCSVTSAADQGGRQTIRRIARENPSAQIVATGCYATRRPAELHALPGVVSVVPNRSKSYLLQAVEQTTSLRFGDGDGPCGAPIAPGTGGRTAYTLRVQTGCEERCSYCIIPTTRGGGRSVPLESVLHEVDRIAGAGFKEVVLTGVHLGSYGRDLEHPSSLIELLRALDATHLDVTFRISSLEPMDCTQEIVAFVAANRDRFAPHFHLPLQHASDRMLEAMRRPYALGYYRRLVDCIVEHLPHASIGSDIIVGFPGESAEDFAANLEYLPQSRLSHLHVFPYSDREGTAASELKGKPDGSVIRTRAAAVRAIGAELTQKFHDRQRGTVRPGLTLEDGTLVVTDNYVKVRIPPGRSRNERVNVRLISATEGELVG